MKTRKIVAAVLFALIAAFAVLMYNFFNTPPLRVYSQNTFLPVVVVTTYSGADVGAQANTAYAGCPSIGCIGIIPDKSTAYSFSTAIVAATANKPFLLEGVSTNGTQLTYTGSATAMTFNCCASAVGLQYGVENLTLTGPGTGGSTIGILLGGTNGAFGANINNVLVSGFHSNIQIGSNAWQFKLNRVYSRAASGGSAFNYPTSLSNTGELPSIRDSVFDSTIGTSYLSSCFLLSGYASPLSIEDSSFDNCQIVQTAGQTQFVNDHWEDPSGLTGGDSATVPFITVSAGQMQFWGGALFYDYVSGSIAAEFLSISGSSTNVTMSGMNFYSPSPLSYCIATSGTSSSSLYVTNSIQNGSAACTTFLNNTGSAPVSVGPATPTVTVETSGSAATYTTPPGTLYLEVEMVGGGGGGLGSGATPGTPGNGASTTFGGSLTAGGGQGGVFASNLGGAGGTASGGSVNIVGAQGCGGNQYATFNAGGCGGSSVYGGAGTGGGAFPAAGTNASTNSGSGGGGAGTGSGTGDGGGGGAGGYVYAVISNPALTYTYTVGSGGTGGTLGTTGAAGGNGAAGIIKITAHFQ